MNRGYQYVIFDLDGTVLDTLQDIADCWNYVLAQHNCPTHDVWKYRYFIGSGAEELLIRAAPYLAQDAPLRARIMQEYLSRYAAHMEDTTAPYLGLTRVLELLRNEGVKLAVLSNKYETDTAAIIRDYYGDTFQIVRGARAGVPYKPDPTALCEVMEELGAERAQTLFVGDTSMDMQTAKNAGVDACGVLWGFRERNELISTGADYIIRSPLELAQIVLGDGACENRAFNTK